MMFPKWERWHKPATADGWCFCSYRNVTPQVSIADCCRL